MLDKTFDVIVYIIIMICFLFAGLIIIYAVVMYFIDQRSITTDIYNAALLTGLGMAISLFLFYMKSWGKKER